ncbi:MAG: hypothetical protein EOO12_02365 [Chitinophagaceae bacterium]|nr:MAG: hypothetical protein EOO12_02365 [Chitinophagaceae bacterium]
MKRLGMCVLMLALCGAAADAQPRLKSKSARKSAVGPAVAGRLEHSSSQAAFAPAQGERFSIADPFLTLYNGRAAGALPLDEPVRPIPNIPRLRYGVAHGHLLFYNTTATTHGGNTGSGSVGTGSSTGNVGTNGVAQGVNGKNPFAGPGIYGNRVRYSGQPVNLPPQRPKEKEDQKPW